MNHSQRTSSREGLVAGIIVPALQAKATIFSRAGLGNWGRFEDLVLWEYWEYEAAGAARVATPNATKASIKGQQS